MHTLSHTDIEPSNTGIPFSSFEPGHHDCFLSPPLIFILMAMREGRGWGERHLSFSEKFPRTGLKIKYGTPTVPESNILRCLVWSRCRGIMTLQSSLSLDRLTKLMFHMLFHVLLLKLSTYKLCLACLEFFPYWIISLFHITTLDNFSISHNLCIPKIYCYGCIMYIFTFVARVWTYVYHTTLYDFENTFFSVIRAQTFHQSEKTRHPIHYLRIRGE